MRPQRRRSRMRIVQVAVTETARHGAHRLEGRRGRGAPVDVIVSEQEFLRQDQEQTCQPKRADPPDGKAGCGKGCDLRR